MERVKAARGTSLRCRSWRQEAILRMLENNLENAEKPEELIIYGGTRKAARDWDAVPPIVEALPSPAHGQELGGPKGKAGAGLQKPPNAPRSPHPEPPPLP